MTFYKIGVFSKLVNLSVSTLRYYDSIGLLVPEIKDEITGYRYYSNNNFEELKLIKLLLNAGFSLEEIILFKNNDPNNILDKKILDKEAEIKEVKKQYKILMSIKKVINENTLENDNKLLKTEDINILRKRYGRKCIYK